MKLVIENVRLGVTSARSVDGGATEHNCEALYMGGKCFVGNPKKHPPGDYATVTVEVEVKQNASTWATKDRSRSGAMVTSSLAFGDIVEAVALKK